MRPFRPPVCLRDMGWEGHTSVSPETAEAGLGHGWCWFSVGTGHSEKHKAMYLPPPNQHLLLHTHTHAQYLSAPAHSGAPTAVAHTQRSAAYLAFPAGSNSAPAPSLPLKRAPPNILPGCCAPSTPSPVHSSSPTTDRENGAEEEAMGGHYHPPETLGSEQQ